ncbi:hypothetical protein BC748_0696 [Flavobacterium dankookense]|uniref:Uncharacterized protein n=1 Tax=Flavobacterium dankookense TaxID=706186 RepID=A0A4R6QGB4_9FLAO|nr:hypothetical protein BC748_0696 [Flavobacterium dankookense]
MNTDFYNLLGGFYCWIFKFCKTKLADEQAEKNKTRNLLTAFILNLTFVVTLAIIITYF